MKIPKRFKLMGASIEVVENPRLMQDRHWAGCCDYENHKIEILPISEIYAASQTKLEQTFCHELTHFLLHASGGCVNAELKDYIHTNEEFVELLGCLIHQVFDTMEY